MEDLERLKRSGGGNDPAAPPDSYWQDRNVLVTGSTGLLGSWLCLRLIAEGANVVALIRDQVPKSYLHLSGCSRKIIIVNGTLSDYDLLLRALNEYEIDTVFHLGAQTIVTIANRSPVGTFEANIRGSWNLLEAARQTCTVKKVVVASSDKAYGEHAHLPYEENFALKGRHPYDVSKSCVDLLAQSYYHTYHLPVGIARCGNIFGGGDLNFNRIVPGTIRSLYHNQEPIIRSDGSPERDYIYVKDTVAAYLCLARGLDRDDLWGEAFNFSNEHPLTVKEIVDKITSLSGKTHLKPQILGQGKQVGEIERQFLSSRKARERLGWRAAYSIDDGLRETLQWYGDFFGGRILAAVPGCFW